MKPEAILVCFAVETEAAPFRRGQPAGTEVLVTGMGAGNAAGGIRQALAGTRPDLVLTCGFAGGLDPALARGTVLFEAEPGDSGGPSEPLARWTDRLRASGAVPGRFHCADRVAVTVAEKRRLREATGADAVEMESGAIRNRCREARVAAITVRVISDAAGDALPLDFNALMTPDYRLHPGRMAVRILRSPATILGLLRLQRHCAAAALRLADVLRQVTGPGR